MHECTNVMDLEDFDTQIKYGHLLLETRECRKCGEVKNLLESFYRQRKDPALKSSYSYECKECTVKRVVENHKKDPSKARRNELRRKYGLTFERSDRMITEFDYADYLWDGRRDDFMKETEKIQIPEPKNKI